MRHIHHLNFFGWLLVGFLLVFQDAYTLRRGQGYKNKAILWYLIWRRISVWARLIPIPIIWYQENLTLALAYASVVFIFYKVVENKLLTNHFFHSVPESIKPNQVIPNLYKEMVMISGGLIMMTLFFLSLIFNW